jgi:glycosyltransferase involved in cell wall biosynthesis
MKIVFVCPYPISNPQNGGQIRSLEIFKTFARFCDEIVLFSKGSDLRNQFSNLKFVQIPDKNSFFTAILKWFLRKLHFNFLNVNSRILLRFIYESLNADIFVFETLSTVELGFLVRLLSKRKIVVFDAHNVEYKLSKARTVLGIETEKILEKTRRIESNLSQYCNLVLTCSDIDKSIFFDQNTLKSDRLLVVPNGTIRRSLKRDQAKSTLCKILFVGDLRTQPNLEAAQFIGTQISPFLDNNQFSLSIVGKSNTDQNLEEEFPDIHFMGYVNDLESIYLDTDIVLAPLLTGSGTRLKILEAMSYGIPVISTKIGAEGIDVVDGENIIIAESNTDFIEAINRIYRNEIDVKNISYNARLLIESKYDWNIISNNLETDLRLLF